MFGAEAGAGQDLGWGSSQFGGALWQCRVPAAGWRVDKAFCHSKKNLCKLSQMGERADIQIGGCFANML